jgi:hypothetical protein
MNVSNSIEETGRNETNRNENRNNQRFDLHQETRKSIEEGFAMLQLNAEKAVNLSLNGWSAAGKEGVSCIAMLMDDARANVASAANLPKELASIKVPSDLVAITNTHAKRQMELITAQNRRLWASMQKLAKAMSSPADTAS